MITPGDVDDRKPLEHRAFMDFLYGKGALMTMSDRLLTKKRAIIKTETAP